MTHSLNWKSGKLTTGDVSEQWLRWTGSLRRVDGEWQIVHEHVSIPMDPVTGVALSDLTPVWSEPLCH